MILSCEGRMQSCHLINNTTQGPDIALLIVLWLIDLLRAHIVRSTHMGICKLGLLVHCPSQAKISNLYVLTQIEENIARLQISVQDLGISNFIALWIYCGHCNIRSSMAVMQTKCDLCQYFPNNFLSYIVLGLASFADYLLKISSFAVLHYYVYLSICFINNSIIVLDYVRVRQLFQNIDLRN